MPFIVIDDYKAKLRTYNLQKIIDEDASVLELAELTAISRVKDQLFERYDTNAIFSASGADRHAYLVQCIINIVIYDLHERLPRVTIPKVVQDNYDKSLAYLDNIREGNLAADLPRRMTETGRPKTLTRWGSVPKKSHL